MLNKEAFASSPAELLFPPRLIPELGGVRGTLWRNFVSTILLLTDNSPEQAAFVLMLARLTNCATCKPNSYRAGQGCAECSKQVLKRFDGSDEELVKLYEDTKIEVKEYLQQSWERFSSAVDKG